MLSSPCQVLLGFDLLHVDAHRPAQAPIRMPGYRSSLSCSASCNGSSLEESRKGRRTEGSVSWLPLFTSTISQSTKKHMIIHIFLHLILSQQQPSKNNWWAPVCWVPVKKKQKNREDMEIPGPLVQEYLESYIHILFYYTALRPGANFWALVSSSMKWVGTFCYLVIFNLYFGEKFGEGLPEQERSNMTWYLN